MGEMTEMALEEHERNWMATHPGGSEADYHRYLDMETEREREQRLRAQSAEEALVGILDALADGTYWIGQSKKKIKIEKLTKQHAENIVGWLERRAGVLHEFYCLLLATGPQPSGEAASESFNADFDRLNEQDPKEWLNETPLVQNLRARAQRKLVKLR